MELILSLDYTIYDHASNARRVRDFSLLPEVQNISGAHLDHYIVGNEELFPRHKAAGT